MTRQNEEMVRNAGVARGAREAVNLTVTDRREPRDARSRCTRHVSLQLQKPITITYGTYNTNN